MRIFHLDDVAVNAVSILAGQLTEVPERHCSILDNGTADPDVLALLTGTIGMRLIQSLREANSRAAPFRRS